MSTRWIEDGSYARLKYLSLSYTLPKSVIDRIFLRKLTIYVSAQNLFTWSAFKGYDPEFSTISGVQYAGFYYGGFPQTRMYMAGARFGL
jgi:hypothetical protein